MANRAFRPPAFARTSQGYGPSEPDYVVTDETPLEHSPIHGDSHMDWTNPNADPKRATIFEHVTEPEDEQMPSPVPVHILNDRVIIERIIHEVVTRTKRPAFAAYSTYTLAGFPLTVAMENPKRGDVTITCQSGGPVYVGSDNTVNANGAGNNVAIPTGAARTFAHTDTIWLNGPTGAIVDVVVERFG